MKLIYFIVLFVFVTSLNINAQIPDSNKLQSYLDSLNDIDSDLKKIFPRWKVCEPDLQLQIYKAFEFLILPVLRVFRVERIPLDSHA